MILLYHKLQYKMSSSVTYTMRTMGNPSPEPEPEPETEPELNNDIMGPWITDDNIIIHNMKYKRFIQVSGSEFTGFNHEIDIRYFDNLEGIVRYTKNKLKELFDKHNMIDLSSDVENIDFHIHSHTFDEILMMEDNSRIYVCNCY